MRKILLALTAATIMASTAVGGEPLTDQQMDAVIAGAANFPPLYGPGINLGGSDALSNAQAASQGPPTPTPGFTAYNGCYPDCNFPPPPPPPPPPTPTQQFSILLSTNGIGLR